MAGQLFIIATVSFGKARNSIVGVGEAPTVGMFKLTQVGSLTVVHHSEEGGGRAVSNGRVDR